MDGKILNQGDLTKSQKNLIEIVEKLGRRGPVIPAGPLEKDQFGRNLRLEGQFIDESGRDLNTEAKELLADLRDIDSETEIMLRGQVMWYDIRSSVWRERPALSALMALAYAKTLIARTGQNTGHTLNIAIDCYAKHHESMSSFVDTFIRTGVTGDGGGVIYWGVQNGGSIRNVSMAERAFTGKGGNWIYGTMSHRPEDYVGAKMGMGGRVVCGKDLMQEFYHNLTKGELPELVKVANPYDFVITVGDLTQNNIDLLEDLIRARTGTDLPKERFLEGVRLGLNMCGSPVGKNLLDIVTAFGADLAVENEMLNEHFNTSNIVDPNEHESEPMERLKAKSEAENRTYLALDPDGDRGTIIAKNSRGRAISLTGTELLLLATENLATYNHSGTVPGIVYDMRTGLAIVLLEEALKKHGTPVELFAAEPGYSFFMKLMGEQENAVLAVENTNHPFITPYTNPLWGATADIGLVQGGDDAAMFLVYILALSAILWEGRNPVNQLDFIRKKYEIPATIIREFKPAIDKKDALRKYDLALEMGRIAKEEIEGGGKYQITTMNSGVRLVEKRSGATVLIRYSNTGPSFTASGEAITMQDSDRMFSLGAAIMNIAVNNVKKSKGDFAFDWANFTSFGDIPTKKAQSIIDVAK